MHFAARSLFCKTRPDSRSECFAAADRLEAGPDYSTVQRNLALELVRVTEAAALASGRWFGKGDKNAADQVRTTSANSYCRRHVARPIDSVHAAAFPTCMELTCDAGQAGNRFHLPRDMARS